MLSRFSLAIVVLSLFGASACSSSSATPPAGDAGSMDVAQGSRDGGNHHDAGHPADARKDVVTEAGREAASVDAGVGTTCGQLILCEEPCSTSACSNSCYAKATGVAQGLFNALGNCITQQCPDAGSSACQQAAATGPCLDDLDACEHDTKVGPPDPDGGSVVVPDSGIADAGTVLSCGALLSCDQACATGDASCQTKCSTQATAAARSLLQTMNDCIASDCPSTDAGPCATESTACSGCQNNAIWTNCIAQLNACEDDHSGGGDGGAAVHVIDGGTVQTLFYPVGYPQCLVLHGATAYLTSSDPPGSIYSVPVSGGTVSTFVMNEPALYTVAIDTQNLYLLSGGTFPGDGVNNEDGKVIQYALDGGVPEAPLTLASGLEYAFNAAYLPALTVDSTTVYFVAGAVGTDGVVMSVPIGGGPTTTLYSGQAFPTALVADATDLYWANWGTFQADGTYNGDGAIMKAPKSGGSSPVALASSQLSPLAMAIDGTSVYWTTAGVFSNIGLPPPNGGAVNQVPKAGGTVVTLASTQNVPVGIAVGIHDVIWADWALGSPGTLSSVPIGGGQKTLLVNGATDPYAVAISGSNILWSDYPPYNSDGALLRLTLPVAP